MSRVPRYLTFSETRKPRGLIEPTQYLGDARARQSAQCCFVLAGAEVAFENQIEICGAQFLRNGE